MQINKKDFMMNKKQIRKIFSHPIATHVYAVGFGMLFSWLLVNNAKQNRMEEREDNALHTFHTEYVDPATGDLVTAETFNPPMFNRAYFDPASIPEINWVNYTNQHIGEVFGEIVAKEMALGIDSVNHRLTTPGKKYGLDYNYCTKAATTAVRDAMIRCQMIKRGKIDLFDKAEGSHEAMYNGDSFVNYFKGQYGNVPGAIIENPTIDAFANMGKGAIVRFPGHTKMFIGIGFIDDSGCVFAPDPHGFPVIASGYNDRFTYYTGDENCMVVDLSKIVYFKLEERGRNSR